MRELKYINEVVTLTLDQDKCSGCGMCIKVCPHAVLDLSNGKAHIARKAFCMECGACEMNCADEAIKVLSGFCGCATGIIEGFFKGKDPENSECCKG